MTLSDKITAAEQFDSTPAGKALKAYRSALTEEEDHLSPARWKAVRAAERALIEEIKRLQELPARIDKFISAVAPSKVSKEMDSIRQEVRRVL